MSGAMFLQVWSDTLVTTGLLVAAILFVRKPFARHFGPRLAYMLWLLPVMRLFLPPLPFADPVPPVPAAASSMTDTMHVRAPTELADIAPAAAEPLWSLSDLVPVLFGFWAAGFVAVLVAALIAHRRFLHGVLRDAVELEPIGSIRLVISDAVDGPVAFGLLRRCVAVPQDFFGRYAASERALAIDHELSHHRYGDLWANAAALLLLATQWFNPFAWRAIRAFRFDQEAACDARVLTMAGTQPCAERTAQYATAIAKAATGARLSLAAPMAVHDNLQERLIMLTKQDISKRRGLVGQLLVGSTSLAVLATTVTLVPAAAAGTPEIDAVVAAAPAEPVDMFPTEDVSLTLPAEPSAPVETVAGPSHVVMIRKVKDDGAERKRGHREHRDVPHKIVQHDRQGSEGEVGAPGQEGAAVKERTRAVEFRVPGSLSRDEILTTLKEQGISGHKAEAIADKLEARRKERFTVTFPAHPAPPAPPIPPKALAVVDHQAFAFSKCSEGKKPVALVERDERKGATRSRVLLTSCSDIAKSKVKALRAARDNFARARSMPGLTPEMRAEMVADLDRAIADIERENH